MSKRPDIERKTATVLMGNEILLRAAKKVLQRMGYGVRTDLASCGEADFVIIGGYYLPLGVVNHVLAANPSLPLILMDTPHASLNGYSKYFYGTIGLGEVSDMNATDEIEKWFAGEKGRLLTEKKEMRNEKSRHAGHRTIKG